jgi:sialic acid synthase SpsE
MEPVLGPIEKRVLDCERDVREVSRQSVVTTRDIAPGETITREMVTIKRPGAGILAYRLDEVIGSVAKRAIESDVPIVEEDLA